MKKISALAVALATAFLFVGVASAEMYVEGYIGGSFASNAGQSFSLRETGPTNFVAATSHFKYGGAFDNPQVIGGVKVGTWFVPEGTLGWSGYPSWAKYFGFYTDFSYQNLNMRSQRISGTTALTNINIAPNVFTPGASRATLAVGSFESDGMAATWAFMFAGRYGFFPDSEVPFGRLQPYVAAGPALMFTSMKPKFTTQTVNTALNGFTLSHMSPGTASATAIALAVDAGVRYMALKNVSIDVSFKYRYAQPHFEYTGVDNPGELLSFRFMGTPATFKLDPVYQLFSFQIGAAYHF